MCILKQYHTLGFKTRNVNAETRTSRSIFFYKNPVCSLQRTGRSKRRLFSPRAFRISKTSRKHRGRIRIRIVTLYRADRVRFPSRREFSRNFYQVFIFLEFLFFSIFLLFINAVFYSHHSLSASRGSLARRREIGSNVPWNNRNSPLCAARETQTRTRRRRRQADGVVISDRAGIKSFDVRRRPAGRPRNIIVCV